MAYKPQFKAEAFMAVMRPDAQYTTRVIARIVGCSRNTAITVLTKLEAEGKVKKIEVEGGTTMWQAIEIDNDVNVEGEPEPEPTLEELVYGYQRKHPDDELATKLWDVIIQHYNPYRVGDYIVWDFEGFREDIREQFAAAKKIKGQPRPKYTGKPIFQVTQCYPHMISVFPVGVCEILGTILERRIPLDAEYIGNVRVGEVRIATTDEVELAKNTPTPEIPEGKDE